MLRPVAEPEPVIRFEDRLCFYEEKSLLAVRCFDLHDGVRPWRISLLSLSSSSFESPGNLDASASRTRSIRALSDFGVLLAHVASLLCCRVCLCGTGFQPASSISRATFD